MKLRKIKFNSKEDWLEKRKQFIGASEVSILTGHNPYQTPLDLYLAKVEGLEKPANERMQWGNILEDSIAREWARRNGNCKIKRSNYLYVYDDLIAATIDRIAYLKVNRFGALENQPIIIEIKNMSDYAFRSYPQIEGVPDIYYMQIQAQMLCTGIFIAKFVALINNGELYEQYVDYNSDTAEQIIIAVREFHQNHIAKRVPPQPKIKDIKVDNIEETTIEGTEEDYNLFHEYKILSSTISELEKKKKELQDKMKERLGNNKTLFYQGNKLFWWDKSVLFNSKDFQKDNPELYEKYKTNVILKLSTAR